MTSKPSKNSSTKINKEAIGAKLRRHRKEKKLTLKQVSELSGVALSTLSKMELGQATVSYDKLEAAARSIGLNLTDLFSSDEPNQSVTGHISKSKIKNNQSEYSTKSYQYQPLFRNYPNPSMMPLIGKITARDISDYETFHKHPGEEFIVVLSGKLRIIFENGEELCLTEKESAYFDSGIGHIYISEGEDDAEAITVMTPSSVP